MKRKKTLLAASGVSLAAAVVCMVLLLFVTGAFANDNIPPTDFLFFEPESPDFGVELPECVSTKSVVFPGSWGESALNSLTAEISEVVSGPDGESRIAVQAHMIQHIMARSNRELNPYLAVRLPAFQSVANPRDTVLALFPLPPEIASRGLRVRDVAAAKARSKSASSTLFYSPIHSISGICSTEVSDDGTRTIVQHDGVFAILESDGKTFLGLEDRLVPGRPYKILLVVRDGGLFDSADAPGTVADPLFLSEFTSGGSGGGGGCSTAGASPFAAMLISPLVLSVLRKKR